MWVWGRNVTRRILGLLLLVAIPATAQTFGPGRSDPACLVVGNTTYRIAAPGARTDYTVRIDSSAPDIRIELTDTPDMADLVLVDDGATPAACRGGAPIKDVKIDADATAPDVTIGFAAPSAPADYRIFIRSEGVEPTAAAALFAASRTAVRKGHHSN